MKNNRDMSCALPPNRILRRFRSRSSLRKIRMFPSESRIRKIQGKFENQFFNDSERVRAISFAPFGASSCTTLPPTACAVGCILPPLRG